MDDYSAFPRLDEVDPYLDILGQRIRAARRELGMSQERLAHESDLDRSYVGRVERGEHNLTFLSLLKLARAMNRDIASLTFDMPLSGSSQSRGGASRAGSP